MARNTDLVSPFNYIGIVICGFPKVDVSSWHDAINIVDSIDSVIVVYRADWNGRVPEQQGA